MRARLPPNDLDVGIRDLKAAGYTVSQIAAKLAITKRRVNLGLAEEGGALKNAVLERERKKAENELKAYVLAAAKNDPRYRLAVIRDMWLVVAEQSLRRMSEDSCPDKFETLQAATATKRATELTDWLEAQAGLPADLPADDEQRRDVVTTAWWRAARGGSPAAARQLAEAVGVRQATTQAIVIRYADERTDAEPAEPPSSPEGTPRLH